MAGEQRPALGPQRFHRPLQQLGRPVEAVGLGAEDPDELGDGALGAGVADRGGIGERPAGVDRGHDDRRVEHAERRRDHLAGDLAHDRAPAAEVGRPVGHAHAAERRPGLGENPSASYSAWHSGEKYTWPVNGSSVAARRRARPGRRWWWRCRSWSQCPASGEVQRPVEEVGGLGQDLVALSGSRGRGRRRSTW